MPRPIAVPCRIRSLVPLTVFLSILSVLLAPPAQCQILWSQLTGGTFAVGSMEFTNQPVDNGWISDDFVVGDGGWYVTRVTLFGRDTGSAASNLGVKLSFMDTAAHDPLAPTFNGAYVTSGSNRNLVFNFSSPFFLAPGTHWLSGWVQRTDLSLGFWLWLPHAPITGSEAMLHEPSGASGLGTDPVPMSVAFGVTQDARFTIEGLAVPEPSAYALAVAALGVGVLRLRRKR